MLQEQSYVPHEFSALSKQHVSAKNKTITEISIHISVYLVKSGYTI
jgi:hypothetical protein